MGEKICDWENTRIQKKEWVRDPSGRDGRPARLHRGNDSCLERKVYGERVERHSPGDQW